MDERKFQKGDRVVVTGYPGFGALAQPGDTGTIVNTFDHGRSDGVDVTVSLDRGKPGRGPWLPMKQGVNSSVLMPIPTFYICRLQGEHDVFYLAEADHEDKLMNGSKWALTSNINEAYRYETEAAAKRSGPRTWCVKEAKQDGDVVAILPAKSVGPNKKGGDQVEIITAIDRLAAI